LDFAITEIRTCYSKQLCYFPNTVWTSACVTLLALLFFSTADQIGDTHGR